MLKVDEPKNLSPYVYAEGDPVNDSDPSGLIIGPRVTDDGGSWHDPRANVVIGPISQPSEVVAGLVLDGELRIVGRSTPLKTADARKLAQWLQPPRGEHPWPAMVKGTILDRFNRDKEPVALTLVEPVVVEVSADTAWSGRSFRRPAGPPGQA